MPRQIKRAHSNSIPTLLLSPTYTPSFLMKPHYSRHVYVILGLLTSVASLPIPILSTSSCDFPAIFNFGDSNSDTGGLSAAFGQAPPPNGETYFHHPAGRYSDGRLIIDFMGTRARICFYFLSQSIWHIYFVTHAIIFLHMHCHDPMLRGCFSSFIIRFRYFSKTEKDGPK